MPRSLFAANRNDRVIGGRALSPARIEMDEINPLLEVFHPLPDRRRERRTQNSDRYSRATPRQAASRLSARASHRRDLRAVSLLGYAARRPYMLLHLRTPGPIERYRTWTQAECHDRREPQRAQASSRRQRRLPRAAHSPLPGKEDQSKIVPNCSTRLRSTRSLSVNPPMNAVPCA
jgi:hypothetical protein